MIKKILILLAVVVVSINIVNGQRAAEYSFQVDSVYNYFFSNTPRAVDTLIDSWIWTVNDSLVSNSNQFYFQFQDTGFFQVCLFTNSKDSLSKDTVCKRIEVIEPVCTSSFTYTDSLGYYFSFENKSIGENLNLSWTFGDGKKSFYPNPQHIYALQDTFEVCLEIQNNDGFCVDTTCNPVVVDFKNSCWSGFSFVQLSINRVQFNIDSTLPIGLYYWDFGDGGTSIQKNPIHDFSAPGDYNVCLTSYLKDSLCYATSCDIITIVDTNYKADFNYKLHQGKTVQFLDNSSGLINRWIWDFGDGNTSELINPVYTYADTGLYNVCLKIIDDFIIVDTVCKDIYVSNLYQLSGNLITDFDSVYVYMIKKQGFQFIVEDSVLSTGSVFLFNDIIPDNYYLFAKPVSGNFTGAYYYNALNIEEAEEIPVFLNTGGIDLYLASSANNVDIPLFYNKTIKIYPNPVKSAFKVELSTAQNQPCIYNIYNLFGQKMDSGCLIINQSRVLCSDLRKGNYVIELSLEGEVFHQLFVKE